MILEFNSVLMTVTLTRLSPTQEPPPSPFWQLTRTMVLVLPGRKLGPWSEFPFLYRFTVLLNSGGSNSPWSEFWSEFPHFMGMGVVPAPSSLLVFGINFLGAIGNGCITLTLWRLHLHSSIF